MCDIDAKIVWDIDMWDIDTKILRTWKYRKKIFQTLNM